MDIHANTSLKKNETYLFNFRQALHSFSIHLISGCLAELNFFFAHHELQSNEAVTEMNPSEFSTNLEAIASSC